MNNNLKISPKEQRLIFSMAKDIFVAQAKSKKEDDQEFVAKCYIKAVEMYLVSQGSDIRFIFPEEVSYSSDDEY